MEILCCMSLPSSLPPHFLSSLFFQISDTGIKCPPNLIIVSDVVSSVKLLTCVFMFWFRNYKWEIVFLWVLFCNVYTVGVVGGLIWQKPSFSENILYYRNTHIWETRKDYMLVWMSAAPPLLTASLMYFIRLCQFYIGEELGALSVCNWASCSNFNWVWLNENIYFRGEHIFHIRLQLQTFILLNLILRSSNHWNAWFNHDDTNSHCCYRNVFFSHLTHLEFIMPYLHKLTRHDSAWQDYQCFHSQTTGIIFVSVTKTNSVFSRL